MEWPILMLMNFTYSQLNKMKSFYHLACIGTFYNKFKTLAVNLTQGYGVLLPIKNLSQWSRDSGKLLPQRNPFLTVARD